MPDHAGAARIVLRDWCTGKLMRYSMPGGTPGGMSEEDAAVLGAVRSRKELRSAVEVKLVKMDAGVSDERDIEWDMVWGAEEEESGEEEDGEEEEEGEEGEENDGDEEEEEEEEEEKKKRPGRRPGAEIRPEKRRVSFAVETAKRRRR